MPHSSYSQILTVLTCHSLEDFPVHLQGDQAASLHACWTAPWHPTLLRQTGKLPAWHRPDQLPDLLPGSLLFAPLSAAGQLPPDSDLFARPEVKLIISPLSRSAAWEELKLPRLPNSPARDSRHPPIAADDFAALGFAYLQLQLLTRRLRYSNTLDEASFTHSTLAAAEAYETEAPDAAREHLQAAFDCLLTERNRYYPVDAQLLELVLLDESHPLPIEFPGARKLNLVLPLDAAVIWKDQYPSRISEIAESAQSGSLQVLGSTLHSYPENFLATATLLQEYLSSRAQFEELFGLPPTVFGRRVGGFHPAQPQILSSLGYRGALHLPLSPDQRTPSVSGTTLGWQGLGQHSLDAISAPPIDADSADAFLGLSLNIGEQVDSAHQATLVFAHWPTSGCEAFNDLTRVARHSSLLGRFVTCDEFFDTLYHPSYGDRFDYDDYRSNTLSNWVAESRANPISAPVELQRLQSEWLALRHLNTMLAAFNHQAALLHRELETLIANLGALAQPALPNQVSTRHSLVNELSTKLRQIRDQLTQAAERFFPKLPPSAQRPATAIFNSQFSPRRIRYAFAAANGKAPPPVAPPVILSEQAGNAAAALVDLPASGFAIVVAEGGKAAPKQPPMLVEQTMRNEFFELQIDPVTGGIRRLREHGSRQTLLSQQLALLVDATQESDENPHAGFARMQTHSLNFDTSQPLQVTCHAAGILHYLGEEWATWQQQITVFRGLRTIEFAAKVELSRQLAPKPWQQYLCSRLAWGDEALGRFRGLHDTHQAVRLEKFLAPTYVHIDNGHLPITLLSDGLSWHRQSQLRILDTLLVVAGETTREFRFGIGVGLEAPHVTASQRGLTPLMLPVQADAPLQQRLFHLTGRNLSIVDSWPTFDAESNCNGAVLRLRESLGNSGKSTLFAPRKLKGARLLDLLGNPLESLTVTDDQVALEYHGHKLFTLQLYW